MDPSTGASQERIAYGNTFATIADATLACQKSLGSCCSAVDNDEASWANNRLLDLNFWIASVGALAHGHASLDYRLDVAQDEEGHTTSILLDLLDLLNQLIQEYHHVSSTLPSLSHTQEPRLHTTGSDIEASEYGPDLGAIKSQVDSILRQLANLAVAVRKAATASRLAKADRSFDPSRYRELNLHLRLLILIQPPENIERTRELLREQSVSDGHPVVQDMLLDTVQSRLIEANLRRRHRFCYAQKRALNLEPRPRVESNAALVTVPEATASYVQEEYRPLVADAVNHSSRERDAAPTVAFTEMTATEILGPVDVSMTVKSTTSLSARTNMSATLSKIEYPAAPRLREHSPNFSCPCCCLPQPASLTLRKGKWRKHIAEDVQPYTCVLDDCPSPMMMYVSRDDWSRHMEEDHEGMPIWECILCDSDKQHHDFKSMEDHLSAEHADAVENVSKFADLCESITTPLLISCPLCSWASQQPTAISQSMLIDHVAKHIHAFALISLPWKQTKDTIYTESQDTVANEMNVYQWREKIVSDLADCPEVQSRDGRNSDELARFTNIDLNDWIRQAMCVTHSNDQQNTDLTQPDYFETHLYFDESGIASNILEISDTEFSEGFEEILSSARLHILHDCSNDDSGAIDIVAIHGQPGHWNLTWTAENGKNWLRDFLPVSLAKADFSVRVMSFSYNAEDVSQPSHMYYEDVARALSESLRSQRVHKLARRPVLFVAQGFGGTVLKKYLIEARRFADVSDSGQSLQCIAGFVYLEVPEPIARIQAMGLPHELEHPADILDSISHQLDHVYHQATQGSSAQIELLSYLETQRNDRASIDKVYSTGALLYEPEKRLIFVDTSTESICTFEESTNTVYEYLLQDILSICESALLLLEGRFAAVTAKNAPDTSGSPVHDERRDHNNLGLFSAPQMDPSFFIGRKSELDEMREILGPGNYSREPPKLILDGIGGVGKTQLAVAYARLHYSEYDSVYWLDASTKAALGIGIRPIVEHLLGRAYDEGFEGIRDNFGRWLSEARETRLLIIFDGYSGSDHFDIRDFWNGAQGSFIITTRQWPYRLVEDLLTIHPLNSLRDRLAILESRSQRKTDEHLECVKSLARQLGGLPLALACAGASLRKGLSPTCFEQYLLDYETRWNIKMKRPLAHEVYRYQALYITWDISYGRLVRDEPQIAHLLKMVYCFGPGDIGYDLVHARPDCRPPAHLAQLLVDPDKFVTAMDILAEYCFIERRSGSTSYTMSGTVLDWALDEMGSDIDEDIYWYVFDSISTSIRRDSENSTPSLQNARLIPHATNLGHPYFMSNKQCWNIPPSRLAQAECIAQLLEQHRQGMAAEDMYERLYHGLRSVRSQQNEEAIVAMIERTELRYRRDTLVYSLRTSLNHEDYNVLWIVSLEIEFKACIEVLDQMFDGYFNLYGLGDYVIAGGSLRGHKIVVALIPNAEFDFGLSAAAVFVERAMLVLPIQLVFDIGLAAGLPTFKSADARANRDIRLGDVLVAFRNEKSIDSIPYEPGADTSIEITVSAGQVNFAALPEYIYGCVMLDGVDLYREGNSFAAYHISMQTRMESKYTAYKFGRPDRRSDVLYSYDDENAVGSKVVERESRTSEGPRVWFGEIITNGKALWSYKERDRVRNRYSDLVGLELGTATWLNLSQAVVVRGVCDYGDGRADGSWRGFAATAAAVYVRGFLMEIDPSDVRSSARGGGST